MAYGNEPRKFDPTNRGTLEKNKEKRDENDRDYKGALNIDGREYWLSGYMKNGKYGPFLSLKAKPKDEARRETYTRAQQEVPQRAPVDDFEF
jgi:hypothetical protein